MNDGATAARIHGADTSAQVGCGSAPRIVIIGAGFAGLEVAKALGRAGLDATVVDRTNHHLFQPLLYQVATAELSATDVAEPIRRILRGYRSIQVIYGEVVDIDEAREVIRLADGEVIPFNFLILAAGSQTDYFGNSQWSRWALGLKGVDDARDIRSRLLVTFEHAERAAEPQERRRLMTIAIIGGGPTGVELAGSIAELSRHTLVSDFRNIDPSSTRILLIEAGQRVLSTFSEKASNYARQRLEKLGVTVLTGRRVTEIGPQSLSLDGEGIDVGLVLWAAGVTASPLATRLGAGTDKGGRVTVDGSMRVSGRRNIFALGDIAAFLDGEGKPLPGLAQVAKQQGQHLGRELVAHIRVGRHLKPFTYSSRGNTAIIGRHAAVFEQARWHIRGWFAWITWAVIHVYLLIGFQNRLQVSIQWLWRYLTYDRGARLIARSEANTIEQKRPRAGGSPGGE